ncbi:MAG: DUF1573 domain-containing protein [Pirellulales bacterium]
MAVASRLLLGLTCLLACAPLAGAQQWAATMFDQTSHDFGAVARGAAVEHRFTLTNLYRDEIHIAVVRASCGCATPSISRQTLKSGERGQVVVRYNTDRFRGQRGATLTVVIDRPAYAEVQLRVDGYIRTDVVLDPGAVRFGDVGQGEASVRRVRVRHAGRSDWRIVDVQPKIPYLDVSWAQTPSRAGEHAYELAVQLNQDAPAGYLREQLLLLTNDRRMSRVPLMVEGRVVPQLSVSPASLSLGSVAPGQRITRQLVVQGKQPFRITGVECDNEHFEFELPEGEKKVHLLPMTFVAGGEPGKFSEVIRIKTDLGPGAVAELTAQVTIGSVAMSEKPAAPVFFARRIAR